MLEERQDWRGRVTAIVAKSNEEFESVVTMNPFGHSLVSQDPLFGEFRLEVLAT